jgi:carboxymethylenebutenolidase
MSSVTVEETETLVPASDGRQIPTLITRPPDGGDGPRVVIICDMYGRSRFYEEMARHLAAEGFVAACPELYVREGPVTAGDMDAAYARWGKWDEPQALADVETVARFAGADGRVGVVGFCSGGTLALNMAARELDVASVCYYGYPTGSTMARVPATPPLDELDRVRGPILGLWAENDPSVGLDNVRHYAEQLHERGVRLSHTVFPGVGHGFMAATSANPTPAAVRVATSAWEQTVGFLRTELA